MIIAFSTNSGYAEPLVARNVSSVWVSTFLAISAFANAGFSPIDDNLVSLSYNPPLLLTIAFLILLGNTCYPLVLRAIIWGLSKTTSRLEETCTWLLYHSRLCYTHLFSSHVSSYLFFVLF